MASHRNTLLSGWEAAELAARFLVTGNYQAGKTSQFGYWLTDVTSVRSFPTVHLDLVLRKTGQLAYQARYYQLHPGQ